MSNLNLKLQEFANLKLNSGRGVVPNDATTEFLLKYRDEIEIDLDEVIFKDIKKRLKNYLEKGTEDFVSDQLQIPGLHLPRCIKIPAEVIGGFIYKNVNDCTLEDLQASRHVKVSNVEAAVKSLDQFDESIRRLTEETSMGWDPTVTVAQAVEELTQADKAA